jgi:hypothetical protein
MPLLTLAFPLIIVFITNEKCNGKLQCFLRYILSWLYGYGVTMVIKILISFAIVNKGTGFGQVAGYTGLGTHSFKGRIWMIFVTFLNVINRSRIESDLAYAITVCLIIYIAVKKRTNLQMIKSLWPLLVVALFPCAWCFVCAVHAGHGWTLWNYSISIFAFLEILWQMCGFKVALFSEVT